jgi:hypothetical protein
MAMAKFPADKKNYRTAGEMLTHSLPTVLRSHGEHLMSMPADAAALRDSWMSFMASSRRYCTSS